MPQSLTKIFVHLIFSTRGRQPLIPAEHQSRLHAYMATALHSLESTVVQVGGVEDHVHILRILNKTMPLSDLVKKIKTDTSKWIKHEFPDLNDFYWQNGYAAFSVS